MFPQQVHVLTETENISGPYGEHTEGYPDYINTWVVFECPLYYDQLEFLSVHRHVLNWCKYLKLDNDAKYKYIIQSDLPIEDHLRREGKIIYNLAWAYLGYVDNQCPIALQLLDYLHERTVSPLDERNLFEKLKSDPLPSYPSHGRITKYNDYGKKKIRKRPKKQKSITYGPPVHR